MMEVGQDAGGGRVRPTENKDRKYVDVFLDWSWESLVELRRNEAIASRLAELYYLSERHIYLIVNTAPVEQWTPSATALTTNMVLKWKMYSVHREIFPGGHEVHSVVVSNRVVSKHRTLQDAKNWMGWKSKLIQARLALLPLMEATA